MKPRSVAVADSNGAGLPYNANDPGKLLPLPKPKYGFREYEWLANGSA
jgi:hypothetical protein